MEETSDQNTDIESFEEDHDQEELLKPSSSEKQNLSSYCNLSLKSKVLTESTKEKLKESKELLKSLRDQLNESMKDFDVVVIPQEFRHKKNNDLQKEGKPELPPYIRKVRNNKDNTITNDIIKECIDNLNPDEILESQEEDGPDALLDVLLQSIRRSIRTFTEQVRLCDSIPRGSKAADVPFASSKQIKLASELHDISTTILMTESEKRDVLVDLKEKMKVRQPEIEAYFERTNINSQRIILENCPYNLIRRITVCKPKVNIKKIQTIIMETINEIITNKSKNIPTKENLKNNISELKETLHSVISSKIINIPSTTKTDIYLKRIQQK